MDETADSRDGRHMIENERTVPYVADVGNFPYDDVDYDTTSFSLASIAKEGRLRRVDIHGHGTKKMPLTEIDFQMLEVARQVLQKNAQMTFVYPIPCTDISVLLVAETMIWARIFKHSIPSIGLLTNDVSGAERVWKELDVSISGDHNLLDQTLPCFRLDGEIPEVLCVGERFPKRLYIGNRYDDWKVDYLIIDQMTGPVANDPQICTFRVTANPLDPSLMYRKKTVWGLSPGLVKCPDQQEGNAATHAGFIGARCETMAQPLSVTIRVVSDVQTEHIIHRLRDDLHELARLHRGTIPAEIIIGMRVGWQYTTNLASLPCRPSDFDLFSGIPPLAARSTAIYAKDIETWAKKLQGEAVVDTALFIASDLGDLRAELEQRPLYLAELRAFIKRSETSLCIVRSRTVVRGLAHALGKSGQERIGSLALQTMNRMTKELPQNDVIIVGLPAPYEWHRIIAGVGRHLHLLVVGQKDAQMSQKMLNNLYHAWQQWTNKDHLIEVWRTLTENASFPSSWQEAPIATPFIITETGKSFQEFSDPFADLEALLESKPFEYDFEDMSEILSEDVLMREDEIQIQALKIVTNIGIIFLQRRKKIEVLEDANIEECKAQDLKPGMVLIVGHGAGRLGLLEAVAEHLKKRRPDLLMAHHIIKSYRLQVRKKFRALGWKIKAFHERLCEIGFTKTYQTVRNHLDEDGPSGPRDFDDVRFMCKGLELAMSEQSIRETFASMERYRSFRRLAGKALAKASRNSYNSDERRIPTQGHVVGVSLKDLQDAVVQATVLYIEEQEELVSINDIGRLM